MMLAGAQEEFSWTSLAVSTGVGAVTSGYSAAAQSGRVGMAVKKLAGKLGRKGDDVAKSGGKRKFMEPIKDADGPHTVWKKNNKGEITNHQTFEPNTNPKNPNKWAKGNRTDVSGKSEFNKNTKQWVDTPHTHDSSAPGGIRPARPDELPKW